MIIVILSCLMNDRYVFLTFSSSVGPEFSRKRGLIFLILALVFIAIGVGVTVNDYNTVVNQFLFI